MVTAPAHNGSGGNGGVPGGDGGGNPGAGDGSGGDGGVPGGGDGGAGGGGGGSAGGEPSGLDLAGEGTITQPVLDVANGVVTGLDDQLGDAGQTIGAGGLINNVTNVVESTGLGHIGDAPAADGSSNLVTDLLNAPGDLLSGDLQGVISNVSHDLSDVLGAVGSLTDGLLSDSGDTTNILPELINSIGDDLSPLPLLSVNGDGAGGGLLQGVIGDLSQSSSGHLADASVGPQSEHSLVLDLLSTPEVGPHHTAEVHAVDTGPTGPNLANLGVLTDGGLLADLGGAGGDGLVDTVLHAATPALSDVTATAPAQDVTSPLDIGGLLNADHGILDLHQVHLV